MPKKEKPVHYVNNKEFLNALKEYRAQVKEAKEKGLPKPRVSEYIGECIYKISNHLSYRPNFINYMFKDDMICDGIENGLKAIDNFDPDKSSNPFGYFTLIIFRAFVRRIKKEKHELKIKNRLLEESGFEEVFSVNGDCDFNSSDMNTIKENVEIRSSRQQYE